MLSLQTQNTSKWESQKRHGNEHRNIYMYFPLSKINYWYNLLYCYARSFIQGDIILVVYMCMNVTLPYWFSKVIYIQGDIILIVYIHMITTCIYLLYSVSVHVYSCSKYSISNHFMYRVVKLHAFVPAKCREYLFFIFVHQIRWPRFKRQFVPERKVFMPLVAV